MSEIENYHQNTPPCQVLKLAVCLFVLRFYSPVNLNGVMSSMVSLPNHTFTGQA